MTERQVLFTCTIFLMLLHVVNNLAEEMRRRVI
jgi:hypothetical protein